MVLQQDFKERHAAAFMITKIRSFKRETIFFGGGGGGGSLFVVLLIRYYIFPSDKTCFLAFYTSILVYYLPAKPISHQLSQ